MHAVSQRVPSDLRGGQTTSKAGTWRAKHPGPRQRLFSPGQLSDEFVNIGGWLTYGDLALDSSAQSGGS